MEEKNTIIDKGVKKKFSLGIWVIVGIIVAGVVVGMAISFTTVIAVKHTSDVNFCGSCHSMKPMAEAYRNSVHGGYGDSGIRATCADCHLPHKSTMGYMIQKVKTGMWDVWVESTHDTSKIDWFEKRNNRREWVYDSGCLHCHENLLLGTRPNKKAFIAHKAYFSKKLLVEGEDGKERAKCVDCHKHVGHYQLEKHLPVLDEDMYDDEVNSDSDH
jgi:cytochrome c-type protein NapC